MGHKRRLAWDVCRCGSSREQVKRRQKRTVHRSCLRVSRSKPLVAVFTRLPVLLLDPSVFTLLADEPLGVLEDQVWVGVVSMVKEVVLVPAVDANFAVLHLVPGILTLRTERSTGEAEREAIVWHWRGCRWSAPIAGRRPGSGAVVLCASR